MAAIRHGVLFLSQPVIRFLTEARASVSFILSQHATFEAKCIDERFAFQNALHMEAHRGTTILVLGILGLVVCAVCGIIAWVMANKDIPKMEAGTMDPEGLGQAKAGKICGMISVILWALAIIAYVVFIVIFVGAAAASGGFEVPQ
ncbi:MAG: hypothetical protein ACO35C_06985 [Pontimonas sp.]